MRRVIAQASQRLVMCQLMLDVMRSLHGTYAPPGEPFGTRMECFFVAICIVLGDIEGKPFSANKIAFYMNMPRTTVRHRIGRLHSWGLLRRRGCRYYANERLLNSIMGLRSYQHIRKLISKASVDLHDLDTGTLRICQDWIGQCGHEED